MRRTTDRVFTPAERRMALIAAVVVIAVTALALATGGLVSPSTGAAARGGYGFADLPGVTEARPLGQG